MGSSTSKYRLFVEPVKNGLFFVGAIWVLTTNVILTPAYDKSLIAFWQGVVHKEHLYHFVDFCRLLLAIGALASAIYLVKMCISLIVFDHSESSFRMHLVPLYRVGRWMEYMLRLLVFCYLFGGGAAHRLIAETVLKGFGLHWLDGLDGPGVVGDFIRISVYLSFLYVISLFWDFVMMICRKNDSCRSSKTKESSSLKGGSGRKEINKIAGQHLAQFFAWTTIGFVFSTGVVKSGLVVWLGAAAILLLVFSVGYAIVDACKSRAMWREFLNVCGHRLTVA